MALVRFLLALVLLHTDGFGAAKLVVDPLVGSLRTATSALRRVPMRFRCAPVVSLCDLSHRVNSDLQCSPVVFRRSFSTKPKDPARISRHCIPTTKVIEDPEIVAGGNPEIKAFIDRLNVKTLPEYLLSRIREIDRYNAFITEVETEAEEKGRQEGEKVGRRAEKIEIARKLMRRVLTLPEIVEDTGLSEAEIAALKPPGVVEEYNESVVNRNMYSTVLAVERREGRQEGEEVGRRNEKIEIARKMLSRKRPLPEIVEDTGLFEAEIEALKSQGAVGGSGVTGPTS